MFRNERVSEGKDDNHAGRVGDVVPTTDSCDPEKFNALYLI